MRVICLLAVLLSPAALRSVTDVVVLTRYDAVLDLPAPEAGAGGES